MAIRTVQTVFTKAKLNMIIGTDSHGVLDLRTGLAEHRRAIRKKIF